MHPTSHLELHELRAYSRVQSLDAVLLGPRERPTLASDLAAWPERLAALLIELPAREIGGQLPPWEQLVELSGLARSRGVRRAPGRRAAVGSARSATRRAATRTSARCSIRVYVSFYKGIGALAGAALAGSAGLHRRGARMAQAHGRHAGAALSRTSHPPRCASTRSSRRCPRGAHAPSRSARRCRDVPGVRILPAAAAGQHVPPPPRARRRTRWPPRATRSPQRERRVDRRPLRARRTPGIVVPGALRRRRPAGASTTRAIAALFGRLVAAPEPRRDDAPRGTGARRFRCNTRATHADLPDARRRCAAGCAPRSWTTRPSPCASSTRSKGRALNAEFRGKDYATNVLTFVYDDEHPRAGDIVLCAPVVRGKRPRRARRWPRTTPTWWSTACCTCRDSTTSAPPTPPPWKRARPRSSRASALPDPYARDG